MKFATWFLLLFIFEGVFAASYYCIDTSHVIRDGDSMEVVRATCGSPIETSSRKERVSVPTEITQWVYMPFRPENPSHTPDYLARLIIIFNGQGKVITLRQSQIQDPQGHPNEPEVAPCGSGGTVQVGDDLSTVQFTCGKPTFINKLQSSQEVVKTIIEWQYPKNITLQFEDGVLVKAMNIGSP